MAIDAKVPWTGYVALAFAVVFFSGVFMNEQGALRALDFNSISGQFGRLGTLAEGSGKLAPNFRGVGGAGPKDAILFSLTILPQIMFSLGVVKVIENLGAFGAAQKLLTPFTRLVMGLPGICTIPIIAGLQNSDSGASMIKQMGDEGVVTQKEKLIFLAFHFPAPAVIVNYFALAGALFVFFKCPVSLPLAVIMLCKLVGANVFRFLVLKFVKE
jgi:Uncharacterized protein conserved in bacteria